MTSADTTVLPEAAPATAAAPDTAPAGSPTVDTAVPTQYLAPASTAPASGPDSSFAITSFVLGIVSVVSSWTFVAPIIGLVFGILALRRKTEERTLALWGVWLNGAMLALTVLVALGVMAFVGFGILASVPYDFR